METFRRGDIVEYQSRPGHFWGAVVSSEPRLLGCQIWVVSLEGLSWQYGQEFTTPRYNAPAVAITALRRAPTRYLEEGLWVTTSQYDLQEIRYVFNPTDGLSRGWRWWTSTGQGPASCYDEARQLVNKAHQLNNPV